MGCLIYGVITLFIGAAICVALDLEGDSAGGIFIMFLCVLGPIIAGIIKNLADEAEKKRIAEEERLEKERVATENRRITEAIRKVESIMQQFTPINVVKLQKAQLINIDIRYINKEVVFTVSQFKDSLRDIVSKCTEIDQAINSILACGGCRDVDEKLNYLSRKSEELHTLKSESDRLHNEISQHKIKLLNEDGNLLYLVKKSLNALFSSKKCIIDGLSLKEFICDEKPSDLELFDYKYVPAILHIDKYYYCLFSNVILVFDANGIFASAIDPTALSIKTERVSVDVWISNNTLPSHQYIDVDSKCIEQGTTRHTWVHTCRDGSPDLRYSYNPRIEYRTDKYEYGKVAVTILGNTVSFCLSSDIATKALEKASREYIRKCNNHHNPIPEFLNLLKIVLEDDDQNIAYIIDTNKRNASTASYFCTIS